MKKDSFLLEKRFNEIAREIGSLVREDNEIPNELFIEFENEFNRISDIYIEERNNINLFHLRHNFHYRKSIFKLQNKQFTESLSLYLTALNDLFSRNSLSSYGDGVLNKMLGPYLITLNNIHKRKMEIDVSQVKKQILDFISSYVKYSNKIDCFTQIIDFLYKIMTKKINFDTISKIKLATKEEYDQLSLLLSDVDNLLNGILVTLSPTKSHIPSYLTEMKFTICKKQFHFLVRNYYFERNQEKKDFLQSIINNKVKELIILSNDSLNYYKAYLSSQSESYKSSPSRKQVLFGKELNVLNSKYYLETYVNKNIFEACKKIDFIKQFLVTKSFYEDISLSPKLLKYFSDEWAMLYIFTKITLLRTETARFNRKLQLSWQNEVMDKINGNLKSLENEFKYEIPDDKGYRLKIIAAQFAGNFSEYFIHRLLREFFDFGPIDDKTPSNFRRLFTAVKTATNKDSIVLNDRSILGDPDIDILIKRKGAVFLKNAKIKEREVRKIENEIENCINKNVFNIFLGFNFIKNLEEMNSIHKTLKILKRKDKRLILEAFDIKDLVTNLLNELKRGGKSKINFSQHDFYRATFDY